MHTNVAASEGSTCNEEFCAIELKWSERALILQRRRTHGPTHYV